MSDENINLLTELSRQERGGKSLPGDCRWEHSDLDDDADVADASNDDADFDADSNNDADVDADLDADADVDDENINPSAERIWQ